MLLPWDFGGEPQMRRGGGDSEFETLSRDGLLPHNHAMANTEPSSATPPPSRSRRRFLGEMLVRQGVITPDQLTEVLQRQKVEPA
jgi:hypothetical protein